MILVILFGELCFISFLILLRVLVKEVLVSWYIVFLECKMKGFLFDKDCEKISNVFNGYYLYREFLDLLIILDKIDFIKYESGLEFIYNN